jgi:hypothetical protein
LCFPVLFVLAIFVYYNYTVSGLGLDTWSYLCHCIIEVFVKVVSGRPTLLGGSLFVECKLATCSFGL